MSEGFAVIPIWLLRDGSVDEKVKMLYLLLSARVNREGVCWPSQTLLASELGVSVRTVQRHLATLREANLVDVRVVNGPKGSHNMYRLLTDRFGGASVPSSGDSPIEGGGDIPVVTPTGGGDTGVVRGGDTSVALTRASRTTSTTGSESQQVAGGRAVEPEVHPSRPIGPGWHPRTVYAHHLMARYPGINLRESCNRFVAFHVARQDTSRSWEALLLNWVSQDWERWREKQGTDDLGVPRGQRPSTQAAPGPGDEGYVDPDETMRLAQDMASRRKRRRTSVSHVKEEQP